MNPFTKHPHSIDETYLQHFKFAFFTGSKLVVCGLCGIIHAIFPFIFTNAISNRVRWLHHELAQRIEAVHHEESQK